MNAWPERIAVTCACCQAVEELFCAMTDPLDASHLRTRLFAMAVSALGWMLMKDRAGRADWLCRRCSVEVPDGQDPVFVASANQWAQWTRIDYSVRPGAAS